MSDPLHNSRYSVSHANRRINELETEIQGFLNSNPYAKVVERDPDTGEDVHKVKLVKPIPVALPGVTFDALNGLRSSLDQSGYAVALAAHTTGRDAKFPFGDTISEVQSRMGSTAKHIPKDVFDVMVALQPYKGGNDLLWALNKAANSQKHEVVIPMAAATARSGFPILKVEQSGSGVRIPRVRWDSAKNEMEFLRVAHDATFHYDFKFTPFIAFGKVEYVGGKEVIGTLRAMSSEVERCLMAIEGEARRLGLFS